MSRPLLDNERLDGYYPSMNKFSFTWQEAIHN